MQTPLIANKAFIRVGLAISLLVSLQVNAFPAPTDKLTICYGVNKSAGLDQKSFSVPCVVNEFAGGGEMSLTYEFNNKEYEIHSSFSGEQRLNGESYVEYMRDEWFQQIPDSAWNDKAYYCYQSKSAHFCTQQ